jgi:alkanesulfonate monooxygenase SsuD/methylene tetrahydromethanopterin reductase-like flavin-dependent oxidoreductase (luciferase family)
VAIDRELYIGSGDRSGVAIDREWLYIGSDDRSGVVVYREWRYVGSGGRSVPVLTCFVGAAAAAHTKHVRTGTFVHMLGDFSIYRRA